MRRDNTSHEHNLSVLLRRRANFLDNGPAQLEWEVLSEPGSLLVCLCIESSLQSKSLTLLSSERDLLNVQTDHYIVSGYTATGFGCYATGGVRTYTPNRDLWHLLQHLAQATQTPTTSSQQFPSASTISTSDSGSVTAPNNRHSGRARHRLSEDSKIALGVGIGVGVPATIAAIATLWITWKYQRRRGQRHSGRQIIQ